VEVKIVERTSYTQLALQKLQKCARNYCRDYGGAAQNRKDYSPYYTRTGTYTDVSGET